jgi:hypothetical protein
VAEPLGIAASNGSSNDDSKSKGNIGIFCYIFGNIAEAWSCYSSRSDGDMLRVWFSCPFVTSECGVKTVATLNHISRDFNCVTFVVRVCVVL